MELMMMSLNNSCRLKIFPSFQLPIKLDWWTFGCMWYDECKSSKDKGAFYIFIHLFIIFPVCFVPGPVSRCATLNHITVIIYYILWTRPASILVYITQPNALTHCGTYGDIDLGQHRLRKLLVAWLHQVFTWTNDHLLSVRPVTIVWGQFHKNTSVIVD